MVLGGEVAPLDYVNGEGGEVAIIDRVERMLTAVRRPARMLCQH